MRVKSMKPVMKTRPHLAIGIGLLLIVACISTEARADGGGRDRAQIEPTAGTWRTWVISSGKDYRAPAPPGFTDTEAELNTLAGLISHNDAADPAADRILGRRRPGLSLDGPDQRAPPRRNTDDRLSRTACTRTWRRPCTTRRSRRGNRSTSTTAGVRARQVAACPRPCRFPNSPSYPSEHAATAQAAATVLAYFLPAEAQSFQTMAEQAGWSRVLAGLQYPSDYYGGTRSRPESRRAGHREGEGGWLDAVWTGTRADRAVQVDRDQSGQRHRPRAGRRCC